jgi:N-ethylmaleimide reductase
MLFEPFVARSLSLSNRTVMSPMTRSRAVDANTPNALMAEYYGQRASAGLIITEGVSPSPNGLGYPRIPGLFNDAQVRGWRMVTDAVHAKGGKIVIQLMHTGRVTHVANLPAGAEVVGPCAVTCPGEMYSDSLGMQPHSVPRAMNERDIAHAVSEYAESARLAIEAGFDGIELHAANGYLIEQFLNPNVNLPQSLRDRGCPRRCAGRRPREGRHQAVALWGVQRHGSFPGRGRAIPRTHHGVVGTGAVVPPCPGSLGDGRTASA